MGILRNRTAIITGGTQGFGLAIAREFLQEDCKVIISSRDKHHIQQALQDLNAGNKADGTVCDVTDINQVLNLANFACQRFTSFDIWINNAGISGPYGPTAFTDPKIFDAVIKTNILGVFTGSHVALRYFLPKQKGKIINLIGRGYKNPVPYQNAYASSKAWVSSFTSALAKENLDSGVGIFSFQPGMMLTDLLLDVDVIQGYEDKLKAFPAIIQALAQPPDIPARKLAWLASAATDGQTGKLVTAQSGIDVIFGFLKAGWRMIRGNDRKNSERLQIRIIEKY